MRLAAGNLPRSGYALDGGQGRWGVRYRAFMNSLWGHVL